MNFPIIERCEESVHLINLLAFTHIKDYQGRLLVRPG